MAGLCGWTGNTQGGGTESILQAMASPFMHGDECEAGRLLHQAYALTTTGKQGAAGIINEGDTWVAWHGYPEWRNEKLRALALASGHAAAIAQGYLRYGIDILKELHGSFSLAIIDIPENTLVLAIDRLGINPLCYTHTGNTVVFSSRADSVARHPMASTSIDPQAIYNYLYFHMIPSPDVIFRGQQKLLPGQYVRITGDKQEKGFYWHIPYEDDNAESKQTLGAEFHTIIDTTISAYGNDSATGCFLSGGTDSSTVAGKLARVCKRSPDTFSIGFDADGFDEMEYARIASRHFNTTPHEYYVTPDDVVNAIPRIAAAYDEPFGNASAIPTYYCAQLAAENGITTMLAGDGGDEIFGGNARYVTQQTLAIYDHVPGILRSMLEPVMLHIPGGEHILPVRKLQSYIRQARLPMPDRMETYNFLHRSSAEDIFNTDFLHAVDINAPINNLREVYYRTHSQNLLHKMLHLDMKITLADNDLRKVTRMCELAGIDVRFPLLDEHMVDFSAKVSPSLKIKGSSLRYFFKDTLKDFLPAEILTKSKHGFGLPFGVWMKTHEPLRELAYDSLNGLKKRGYIKESYIDWLIKMHGGEHASYYGVMIWVMMMLEQWFIHHENN